MGGDEVVRVDNGVGGGDTSSSGRSRGWGGDKPKVEVENKKDEGCVDSYPGFR